MGERSSPEVKRRPDSLAADREVMGATETDCRTEEGITVGLIDSVITVARVLAKRDLSTPAVLEALRDLRTDSDVASLLREESCQAG